MKPRFILFAVPLVLVMSLVSFKWPVTNGTVTSTFCESRWDHFHDGIDMTSIDDKVYPVEDGKLLFYWDKALFGVKVGTATDTEFVEDMVRAGAYRVERAH